MTTESKKERLRRERLEAEQRAQAQAQRQKMLKLLLGVGLAAVLAIAVLIVVSQSGSSDRDADTNELLSGLNQEGTVLGDPKAEVVFVEFGDLQCPHCRNFAQDVAPEIIEGPVREGKVRYEFRNWPILGPGSIFAAQAALAAAEQGRYWEFVDLVFAEPNLQVNIDNLREIAEEAGVADLEKWEADLENPDFEEQFKQTQREAGKLGFSGTPSFAIRVGDGELQPIRPPESAADVEAAAEEAS
jgi:protein-disulfide isomerase